MDITRTPVFQRRLCRKGVTVISKQKTRVKVHVCLGSRFFFLYVPFMSGIDFVGFVVCI